MRTAVTVAVLVGLLFAAAGPQLGRRLAPALATRLLVPASLAVASSTVFVMAVMAFTWVGQFPEVAEQGPWSPDTLRATSPIPASVAITSSALLVPAGILAAVIVVRRIRGLLAVHRICAPLGAPGSLVVVDSERPDAFATPEATGRIVVTTGLLRALTGAERRVVLAHERSHISHRHAWWILAADVAAAANPLLRPTAAAIRYATERWADEDAAAAVADRRLVARVVARTALLARPAAPQAAVPAATGGDVPARVRALLRSPPTRRPLAVAAVAALLFAGGIATVAVERGGERLFENAGIPASHQPPLL